MKIKKIDIQITNRKYATDVSMLVDKPEFLHEIDRLRTKWSITELFSPYDMEGFLVSKVLKKDHDSRLEEFNKDICETLKMFNRDIGFRRVVESSLIAGVVPEHFYERCYFDVVTVNEKADLNHPERYQYAILMSPRTENGLFALYIDQTF